MKNNKYPLIVSNALFLSLTILVSLSSCGQNNLREQIEDGGLISQKPCSPPCFWNITPGETTEDQVAEILSRRGIARYCEFNNSTKSIACENLFLIGFAPGGYVEEMSITPRVTILVRGVIEKYNTPDAVEVIYDVLSTPENNYLDMWFYYDEIHTCIRLEYQENWPSYLLEEDTPVFYITYYDDVSYTERKSSSEYLTEWHGYGLYDEPAVNDE